MIIMASGIARVRVRPMAPTATMDVEQDGGHPPNNRWTDMQPSLILDSYVMIN